jgi:hypothetical protein
MNAVSMMIVIPVLPRLVRSFTGSTAGAAHLLSARYIRQQRAAQLFS